MNRESYVVRVNPGISTLGSLNPETLGLRKKIYAEGLNNAREKSGAILRLIFGPMHRNVSYARAQLTTRMLFGTLLILNGFVVGSQPLMAFTAVPVFSVIVGVMLICGLLTRISMAFSTICFAVISIDGLVGGLLPGMEMCISLLSLTFAVIGPGLYSFDGSLRRKIFKHVKKVETRKLLERRASYRAYQYLNSI